MPRRSGSLGIVAATAAALAFGATLLTPVGPAGADPAKETPQLSREGRWLVDQHGRIVLVHGQNLVWKNDPYVPSDSAEGFTAADAEWLAEHGFNGARIGTLWAGVTPDSPGEVDEDYLDDWQRVIDLLADKGIWMQYDFHQDMWHETYGGEGVPDWAAKRPAPYNLHPPIKLSFPATYITPELATVYDNFWANEFGVQDGWAAAWAAAWAAVAERWGDQPYSMGYDLINEPWAGKEWLSCPITGCAKSYRDEFQPAYEKATAAIRRADPDGIVWYESQLLASQVPNSRFGPANDDQVGYSWHSYCPFGFLDSQGIPIGVGGCKAYDENHHRKALEQAETMGATSLMSEFGATDNTELLAIDTAAADDHFASWMHWAYKHWDDPTTADGRQGMFADDADLSTVKTEKLRTLVRTYPQATAGTPVDLSFDPATGEFSYTYEPAADIDEPTEIFVSPIHYPSGPDIAVEGGRVVGEADHNRILVEAVGTEPVTVTID
ncbi:cellulase family glycosylhydrolase [Nocardioides sp. NPDC006273]|uniref:glycoside hydrolase family 5 protein n=1 Tax=Nocardioides sp. NPDC006273 TaxID=3155598 RepID=UPI0033BC1F99